MSSYISIIFLKYDVDSLSIYESDIRQRMASNQDYNGQ